MSRSTSLFTCIYCGDRKPEDKFNREHVLPKAFGKYRNNFVLHRVVCTDCNSWFAHNLDIELARDTIEGTERSRLDGKKPRYIVGRGRLQIRLRGTEFDGAILEGRPSDERGGQMVLGPAAQVGLRSSSSGPYRWFRLRDMPSLGDLTALGLQPRDFRFWGCEEHEAQAAPDRGGYPVRLGPIPPPKDVLFGPNDTIPIRIEGEIDDLLKRAVAKVAFNYLAYHNEGVARMDQFADIRRYIRYGDTIAQDFVTIVREPVLGNVPAGIQILSHVIAITWDQRRLAVIGQVSLYGWFHYRIELASGFALRMASVEGGHFFNPNVGMIEPLTKRPQPMVDLTKHVKVGRG